MIRSMIVSVAPETYRIEFRDPDRTAVTVDGAVPFRWFGSEPLYGAAPRASWVSLFEKAYAKAFVPEGYEGLGGDHPRLALMRVTGRRVRDFDVDGDLSPPRSAEEWAQLLAAFRSGAPMVAGSRIAQTRADIVPMHAYAVTRVEREAGDVAFVRLYDPERLNAYPDGELRLTFDEFVAYFYYVSIADAEGQS
jgi:hypothetical protein